MKESNHGTMIAGIVLVILGGLFFAMNLIPGLDAAKTWPLILIVTGIGFCLPAFVWYSSRESLAGLFIPGCVFLVLGAIFLFNTLTGIWSIWAIAWMLIPASVGLGLMLSTWVGHWDKSVKQVGAWMLVISVSLFAVFAAMFSNVVIKSIGSGILVLTGLVMLIRSFTKKPAAE